MATLGLASTRANVLVNGLNTWKVKWGIGETPDVAYYLLGNLVDGRFTANTLTQPTSRGYQKPFAIRLEASAKMLSTDKTTVLQLLHNLGNAQLSHSIAAISGENYQGNWGTRWRFDSSSDYDGNRFIEVTADHTILLTHASLADWEDVIAAAPATGTPNVADTLYTWAASTLAPAGVSTITIDPAGDVETIGNFRNAKLTAELLTTPDSQGRSVGYAIRLDVEAEMMQTDEEAHYLDNQFSSTDSFVVTLADGTIFTLTSKSGISWEYRNEGNIDGIAHTRLTGGGIVLLSEWAGLIS